MRPKPPTKISPVRSMVFMSVLLALLHGGCDVQGTIYADGGEPDPSKNQFLVQSLELNGSTQEDAAVSVSGVDDQDGTQDVSWQVGFVMDGGDQQTSLPLDQGQLQSHTFNVRAVRAADQQETYKRVTITFYD